MTWGTDPKIHLSGTALEIGTESLVVHLAESDRRLWPELGRRVKVEIPWPAPDGESEARFFTCRGVVERTHESPDGGVRLSFSFRKGRFTDSAGLKPRSNGRSAAAPGGSGEWTM